MEPRSAAAEASPKGQLEYIKLDLITILSKRDLQPIRPDLYLTGIPSRKEKKGIYYGAHIPQYIFVFVYTRNVHSTVHSFRSIIRTLTSLQQQQQSFGMKIPPIPIKRDCAVPSSASNQSYYYYYYQPAGSDNIIRTFFLLYYRPSHSFLLDCFSFFFHSRIPQ